MKKEVEVIFSAETEQLYLYLKEKSSKSKIVKSIFSAINQKIILVKNDIHYGNPVSKELIPPDYKIKYGITNLFRIELPDFWRMFYTLTNDENSIKIIVFIIDILDHKEYNKKLGYKKK